jgi:alkanesulfonate monooxygenase SsuD/methylene tetrahydromethanopterin reductase-like flavin-dependent oxidoreductase (luciferase family)
VRTPQSGGTIQAIMACWQEADQLGFDTAWLNDHFVGVPGTHGQTTPVQTPSAEAWTLLSALLVQTQRVRGGILVAGNTYRHPALVAHMARTADVLSNGRLEFGFGFGWSEPEHEMFGWELPPVPERARWFDEACTLIKRLWTESDVTFDGHKYRLRNAVLEPKPIQKPYPHFVVGASGLRFALRAVAVHADEWNDRPVDLETYRERVEALERHCRAIGRDPAAIQRSMQFPVTREGVSPTALAARINSYIRLGVDHVLFQLSGPFQPECVRWLWREVVPAVRDLAGA